MYNLVIRLGNVYLIIYILGRFSFDCTGQLHFFSYSTSGKPHKLLETQTLSLQNQHNDTDRCKYPYTVLPMDVTSLLKGSRVSIPMRLYSLHGICANCDGAGFMLNLAQYSTLCPNWSFQWCGLGLLFYTELYLFWCISPFEQYGKNISSPCFISLVYTATSNWQTETY